jgi:hypothetical protein
MKRKNLWFNLHMMDDDDCGEEKICRTSIPYLCGKIFRTSFRTYMLWVFRMHFEDIIKSRNLRKKTELTGILRVTDFTKVSSLKKFNNTHSHTKKGMYFQSDDHPESKHENDTCYYLLPVNPLLVSIELTRPLIREGDRLRTGKNRAPNPLLLVSGAAFILLLDRSDSTTVTIR